MSIWFIGLQKAGATALPSRGKVAQLRRGCALSGGRMGPEEPGCWQTVFSWRPVDEIMLNIQLNRIVIHGS